MTKVLFDAFWDDEYLPFLPEDLIRAGLEEDVVFYGITEEKGETPVGAAAAELMGNGAVRLLHLYIKEEERGKGYGKELLGEVVTDLLTRGTERLVVTYFPGESEALDKLLSPYEGEELDSAKMLFSFPLSNVEEVYLPVVTGEAAKPLSKASKEELKALFKLLSSEKLPVQLGQVIRDCEEEYSFYYSKKGVPEAVLFTEVLEGELRFPLLYSEAGSINALESLLTAVGEAIRRDFPPETKVSFMTNNEKLSGFLSKVLGITGRGAVDFWVDLSRMDDFRDEDEWEEMAI